MRTVYFGTASASSAIAPQIVMPATRSPTAKPEPAGASRTMPETSPPLTNGGGVAIWYSPRLCSRSGNATPAAWTSTSSRAPSAAGWAPHRLGDLGELERIRPVERADDDRAHQARTSTTTLPIASRVSSVRSASALCSRLKREPTSVRIRPARGERLDRVVDHPDRAGLDRVHDAHLDADDGQVAQQQPVDLQLRDRPAGEADDREPPADPQRAQRVEEAVPADGVDDGVRAAELAHLGQPVAGRAHDVIGAERPHRLLLRVGRHHRDRARVQRGRDLDRRRADAARRALHEHGLPRHDTEPLQRVPGRAVVEIQRRALREGHRLRQPDRVLRHHQRVLRGGAELAQPGDAVADREARTRRPRPRRRRPRRRSRTAVPAAAGTRRGCAADPGTPPRPRGPRPGAVPPFPTGARPRAAGTSITSTASGPPSVCSIAARIMPPRRTTAARDGRAAAGRAATSAR